MPAVGRGTIAYASRNPENVWGFVSMAGDPFSLLKSRFDSAEKDIPMTKQDGPKDPGPKDPGFKPRKESVEAKHPKFGPQRGKFSSKQVAQRPAIFRGGPRGR